MLAPMHPDEFAALMQDELFNQRTIRALADLSPEEFAAQKLKILDRNKHLVPLVYNRAQRHFLANRGHRNIVVKARHLGLTSVIAAENFRHNITGAASTYTLAHLDATTQAIRRLVQKYWKYLPDHERPEMKYSNNTITTYPALDSEAMIATAGSPNSGRGMQSITHIHASEAAYFKDLEAILVGVMQAGNPEITLESSANGHSNYFADLVFKTLEEGDESEWTLFFYPWHWEDSYRTRLEPGETLDYTEDELHLIKTHHLTPEQLKWRRNKIKEVGERFFRQEYPETVEQAFLDSGDAVFGDLAGVFWTPPDDYKPIPGHEYRMGVDLGQTFDYTAVSIMDADDNREVVLQRFRKQPWAEMRHEILSLAEKYHVEKIIVERNSGSEMIEQMDTEAYERRIPVTIQGFVMTNQKKARLVTRFQHAIYEEGLKLLDEDFGTQELRQFVTKQSSSGLWIYEAPAPLHDDTVIARMLCWYGCENRIPVSW